MAADPPSAAEPGPGGAPAQSAGYRVVARRYRPQRFDELVGQEHVARGLSGAIESGRVGHAYLFTGARGVGKTSAARIFAKALECAAGPAAEPCNACDTCTAIAAGQDVDVVEIDAASNRGIDEIRSLRQNVAVRPARGRFKIYIIDEVHMLTREAFNALLKTLEEPPGHVKFVLCTTEPEKLPITILSRCQRFDFVTVDAAAIARRLAQIVAAEGTSVTDEALALIARRAAGSMRDSQSLLEQLLGASTGPIGVDDVHAVIGTGREERVGALVAAIAARDAAAALAALDESLAGGADPGGVLEQVLGALRDCLVASVGCGPERLLQGDGLGIDLAATGRRLGTETVLAMLQILDQSLARMRSSGHVAVLAEMAVVRLARLDDLDSLASAVERIAGQAATPPRGPAPAPVAPPAAEPQREKKTTDLTAGADPAPAAAAKPALSAAPATPATPAAPALSAAPATTAPGPEGPPGGDPLLLWRQCGEEVGGLVAEYAAEAVAATWEGDVLRVVLPDGAGRALRMLAAPPTAAKLDAALSAAAGRPVRHRAQSAPPADRPRDAAAPRPGPAAAGKPGATEDRADAPPPAAVPVRSQAALVRDSLDHPLVAHARGVLDAAIRKVEAGRPRPVAAAAATGEGEEREEAAGGDVGAE